MEPITHLLTGATLSRAGFNRKTALATVTMTLAAEAADLDMLAYFRGSAYGFIQHRGITHTFVGIPVMAGLVIGLVWLMDALWQRLRRASKPQPSIRRWGWLYLFACIAGLSHILLDFTNSYGVRPFYPFWRNWYAWDIVFIIEPLMLAVLFAALVLPWLFGMVNQEIGVRESGPRGRGAAIAALLFIVVLWGVRDIEHRRALAALNTVEYHSEAAKRVAAFPYMVNPFQWAGVAETSNAYISIRIDSLHPKAVPGNDAQSYYKSEPTEATRAAYSTDLGRAYMNWARFPLVEAELLSTADPAGGSAADGPPRAGRVGELVHFTDVRFLYPNSRRRVLEAYVLLDSRLHAEAEGFKAPNGPR